MKILKKILTKEIILAILFYFHLTFGFLIISLISFTYQIENIKMATLWSVIFLVLYALRGAFTLEKKGDKNGIS